MAAGCSTGGGSPTLNNLVFSGNTAGKGAAYYGGGAMYNTRSSSPALTHVTFVANSAGTGGGMFTRNSAFHEGGAMFNTGASNPVLTNVSFIDNATTGGSGGGGGINNYNSDPILTNVTFSGNHALAGGGISNWQSRLTLTNVTFRGNTSKNYGAAMYSQESSPTITNTIIWGNTPGDSQMLNDRGKSNVTYSLIAGGFPGEGNLSASPQLGDLWEDDSALPAFVLPPGSPAIDAGSPSLCPETDQLGLPRPVDGDGDGSARCDMGAFEYQLP